MIYLFLLLLSLCSPAMANDGSPPAPWTEKQWQRIQSLHLSQLPTEPSDKSNAVMQNPAAIALGRELFFDRRLSRNGAVSCARCHQPERAFSDGRQHALGLQTGSRNTPSLLNVAYQDWFFWDGRADSLWSQALGPIENPNEHGISRTELVKIISRSPHYRKQMEAVFGHWPNPQETHLWPDDATPEGNIAGVKQWKTLDKTTRETIDKSFSQFGKVVAAYTATLKSRETAFDRYVSELQQGKRSNRISDQAKRGLALFIDDRSACLFCHSGPLLSNGEFQNTGTGIPNVDTGRSEVVEELRWNRFNCLGAHSDSHDGACNPLRYTNHNRHEQFGAFKVPSLRNVANTTPFMHDGRYNNLADAIRHYHQVSALGLDTHLPAIQLSEQDIRALIAFLNALSEPSDPLH